MKAPEIDRWILSALQTLVKKVTAAFDDYEPTQAGRLIEDFVDEHSATGMCAFAAAGSGRANTARTRSQLTRRYMNAWKL
jgi:valyl-tRNA synthetase